LYVFLGYEQQGHDDPKAYKPTWYGSTAYNPTAVLQPIFWGLLGYLHRPYKPTGLHPYWPMTLQAL